MLCLLYLGFDGQRNAVAETRHLSLQIAPIVPSLDLSNSIARCGSTGLGEKITTTAVVAAGLDKSYWQATDSLQVSQARGSHYPSTANVTVSTGAGGADDQTQLARKLQCQPFN
jgi:hypothetical protein